MNTNVQPVPLAHFAAHDIVKIRGVSYVPAKRDHYGHVLRRADDLALNEEFTHAQINDLRLANELEVQRGHFDGEVRVCQRAEWSIKAVRTCIIHATRLSKLPASHGSAPWRKRAASLNGLGGRQTTREASAFECWIVDTIAGRPVESCGLLASLPLHAVVEGAEMFGAAFLKGRAFDPDQMGGDDWWLAGDAGFRLLREGQPGIHQLVKSLLSDFMQSAEYWSATAILGHRLHYWLTDRATDPVFDLLKDWIRAHLANNAPLGARESVLGVPLGTIRTHSLASASDEAGVPIETAREALRGREPIFPGHRRADRILYSADDARAALREIAPIGSLLRSRHERSKPPIPYSQN